MCTGVSFSAPYFLHDDAFTLPLLCSMYLKLACPVKAHPHLYVNANKAHGTEANANKCQKVASSAFATQANEQAFRWLFVDCPNGFSFLKNCRQWRSVRPHQDDCECIFLWSTDSRQIAFACSPNIHRISEWRRMLFAYVTTLCISRAFRICVQMWTRLKEPHQHLAMFPVQFIYILNVSIDSPFKQIWLVLYSSQFSIPLDWANISTLFLNSHLTQFSRKTRILRSTDERNHTNVF